MEERGTMMIETFAVVLLIKQQENGLFDPDRLTKKKRKTNDALPNFQRRSEKIRSFLFRNAPHPQKAPSAIIMLMINVRCAYHTSSITS